MKKSNFYRSVSQILFAAGMLSAPFIVKFPLAIFVWVLMLLIASQQMITYKQLYIIENNISEIEAKILVRKQKLIVRIIQVAILITAVLIGTQTFHKINFE
ncbi:MAG: hypothetical protein ABL872_09270 [Lacibacter sp.]